MNTDQEVQKGKADLLWEAESHQILGSAMAVLNSLGSGLSEKVYENALCVEFGHREIRFDQQRRFEVRYRSVLVGEFIPDLIAFEKVVVDTKTVEKIGLPERGQMINYLRITGYRVGLIINFKHSKLEWERIVL